MITYLLRRLLWLFPVLFTVALVTFVIMRNAPGSPWDVEAENKRALDPTTQRALEEFYGLNKPLWRQYIAYTIGDVDKEENLFAARCAEI